jgi:hypothetical protein
MVTTETKAGNVQSKFSLQIDIGKGQAIFFGRIENEENKTLELYSIMYIKIIKDNKRDEWCA